MVKNGVKYVIQKYFMPDIHIDTRSEEDGVPYDLWARQGLIKLSDGARVNYTDVTEWFVEMKEKHDIIPLWIGFDSWNANYWEQEMTSTGFVLEPVIQGAKTMSMPMKDMKADLTMKTLNYNDNPILAWCLTNTIIKVDDNENIRPIKGKNNRKRIDGAVSLIDAYVVYLRHKEDYDNLMG